MTNMIEDFTPEQERTIFELRNQMKNELPTEIYEDQMLLYKFLKARNFNLKKSETMLRKNLLFRKCIQVDTLINFKSNEVLHKYIAQSFLGFDKDGCPIYYIAIGNIDGIGIFKAANSLYILKHVLACIERDLELQRQQSKKLNKAICQSVHIYDLDKLSFAQATHKSSIGMFLRGIDIFQDNYPEMLKKIYLINAAQYFTLAWTLVKPFLEPALLEKIHIYGQSDWKEELLKNIDENILPAFLGGQRTDADGNPQCLTTVKHGGKVPESNYLVKDIEKTAQKTGMIRIRVERKSSTSIPINIEKPMSFLNWEFEIKCYDIGFGLTIETSDDEPEELIPIHRFETENEPISGMYKCKDTGKYAIVFDNSYSWIHHKEICYRTWVTDSDDME